jgi:hypothetical protein
MQVVRAGYFTASLYEAKTNTSTVLLKRTKYNEVLNYKNPGGDQFFSAKLLLD